MGRLWWRLWMAGLSTATLATLAGGAVLGPDSAFPGSSEEESNAPWPGGRQPKPFDEWPIKEDGMPDGCWKSSVLQDVHLNWPGTCKDLYRVHTSNSALGCHESCTRNPLCAVWEYNFMTECWQGLGFHCGDDLRPDWEGQLLASGAQRLQHGDVKVLWNLKGWTITGLQRLSMLPSTNMTQGMDRCRQWCYSSLTCGYWQFSATLGCWVEDTQHAKAIQHPLTTAVALKDLAGIWMAGEYIQHSCPPEPARSALPGNERVAAEAAEVVATFVSEWTKDLAGTALILFGCGVAFCIARRRSSESGKSYFNLEFLEDGEVPEPKDFTKAMSRSSSQSSVASTPGNTISAVGWSFLQPKRLHKILKGEGFATVAEREDVAAAAPGGPPTLANYLAWRRACITAVLSIGIVSYTMQLRVLSSTWSHHFYFKKVWLDPELQSYEAWVVSNPVNPSFLEYGRQKAAIMFAGVLNEVLWGASILELIVCLVELVPLAMLVLALWNWTSFAKSRHYVLWAWFFAFFSPFVVSLFPMRYMLSFSAVDAQADDFVHEFAVAMNLDKAQAMLLGSCDKITTEAFEKKLVNFGDTLKKTCNVFGGFPIELAAPCTDTQVLCSGNLVKAVNGCREAVMQFDMGHVEKAAEILQAECNDVRGMFTSSVGSSAERRNAQTQAFDVLVGMMRMPFHFLVPSVEGISITVSVFHALFMVVPPLGGIIPGIVVAGFTSKVLAPHSELPGAIIIIIPIVLATLGWVATTILFQYVSDMWLLGLLLVLQCAPLFQVALCALYRVTRPLDQDVVIRCARNATKIIVVLMAVIFSILGKNVMDLLNSRLSVPGMELIAWFHVNWGRLAFACTVHTVYSFALTSFGASDWMIGDIAAQSRYWVRHWKDHTRKGGNDLPSARMDSASSQAQLEWLEQENAENSGDEEQFLRNPMAEQDNDLNQLLWHKLDRFQMTSLALSSAPGSPTSMTSLKMQRFANFSVGSFSSSLQPLARERTNSVEVDTAALLPLSGNFVPGSLKTTPLVGQRSIAQMKPAVKFTTPSTVSTRIDSRSGSREWNRERSVSR